MTTSGYPKYPKAQNSVLDQGAGGKDDPLQPHAAHGLSLDLGPGS
jgi:hypothetical protein